MTPNKAFRVSESKLSPYAAYEKTAKNYDTIIRSAGKNISSSMERQENRKRDTTSQVFIANGPKLFTPQFDYSKLKNYNSSNVLAGQRDEIYSPAKKYSTSSLSLSHWEAKSNIPNLVNSSSVPFNPINGRENYNKYFIKSIAGKSDFSGNKKQKGVSEYSDLTKVSYFNTNDQYAKAIRSNNLLFRKSHPLTNGSLN